MPTIDLNCDLGELPGPSGLNSDLDLLEWVTSINLACGLHAGDPDRIVTLAHAALKRGVSIGAHPSLPDREGFGRRLVSLSPSAIHNWVLYQIAAVAGLLRGCGAKLSHVKPHGALYHLAARDRQVANAIVEAVKTLDAECAVVGLAGSAMIPAAIEAGLPVLQEIFADRAYRPDGHLVPRDEPGAVLTEGDPIAERAVQMVREQVVLATDGSKIAVQPDTICIHGDTPFAAQLARQVRDRLAAAGWQVIAAAPRPRLFRVRN